MILGTRGFLGSLITNPSSTFKNSKYRIQYGWLKCKKLLDKDRIWYLGFLGVADYESELNIYKFKMSGATWQTKMQEAKDYAANVSLYFYIFCIISRARIKRRKIGCGFLLLFFFRIVFMFNLFLFPPVWLLPYTCAFSFFPFPPIFPFPFHSLLSRQRFSPLPWDRSYSLLCSIVFARGHRKTAENPCRYNRSFNRVCFQSTISEKWPSAQRFDVQAVDRRSLIQVLSQREAAWIGWSPGTGHLYHTLNLPVRNCNNLYQFLADSTMVTQSIAWTHSKFYVCAALPCTRQFMLSSMKVLYDLPTHSTPPRPIHSYTPHVSRLFRVLTTTLACLLAAPSSCIGKTSRLHRLSSWVVNVHMLEWLYRNLHAKTFYFEIQQKWDEILTSYDSKERLFVFYTKM